MRNIPFALALALSLAALPAAALAQMPPGMPGLPPGARGGPVEPGGDDGGPQEPGGPGGPPPMMIRYAGFAFPAAASEKGGEGTGGFGLALLNVVAPPPGAEAGKAGAAGVRPPLGDLTLDGERYFIVEGKLAEGGGAPGAGGPEGGPKLDGLQGKLSKSWFARPEVAGEPGAERKMGAPQGKPQIVGEVALKGEDKPAAKGRDGEKKFRVLRGRASTGEGKFDLYLLPLPGGPPRGGN